MPQVCVCDLPPTRDHWMTLLPFHLPTTKGARWAMGARPVPLVPFLPSSSLPRGCQVWQPDTLSMLLSDWRPPGASGDSQPLYTHSGAHPCDMQVSSCVDRAVLPLLAPSISLAMLLHAPVWPQHVHIGLCTCHLLAYTSEHRPPSSRASSGGEGQAKARTQDVLIILHYKVLSRHFSPQV